MGVGFSETAIFHKFCCSLLRLKYDLEGFGQTKLGTHKPMITPVDIQVSIRGGEQRIDVSPLAIELIANLLNDFIYEFKERDSKSILARHHRALDFVFGELGGILAKASETLRVERQMSSIDILHWLAPRWPDALKGPALGFVFDKE
jgi:hypothetical protein